MTWARISLYAGNSALAGVTLLAVIVLYRKTTAGDADEQASYRGVISTLSRREAIIDQDVLRLRQGYLHHYDTLDAGMQQIAESMVRLNAVPTYVDAVSRAKVLAAIDRYRLATQSKQEAIESFKSDRSILVNSLRYLPIEVARLADSSSPPEDRALAVRMGPALQGILLYNLHGEVVESTAVNDLLDSIRSDPSVQAGGQAHVSLALDHATRILTFKPRVDVDTARIMDATSKRMLDEVSEAFDAGNRIAMYTGNIYRTALIALCLLLAMGLVHFIYRLRRAMASLVSANDHLEQRVAERTVDLSTANAALAVQNGERQRAIAELISAQARIQQIVTLMPAVLIGTDAERRIVLWNAAAEAQFGISMGEALGRPLAECGIACDFAALHLQLKEHDQAPVHLPEVPCSRPGGNPGVLALSACLLPNEGAAAGLLLAASDITMLKVMEAQLLHAQKMESIGQLAAGVAHEINTPVQFVGDNLRFLQTACQDLLPVLVSCQTLVAIATNLDAKTQMAVVVSKLGDDLRDADAAFLLEEMPKAIAQSLEGVERVATIVKSLKEFSHPDNDQFVAINLQKAVESTLNVARNEYKYVADLVTDFATDLPAVPCLPGELNQAVLNLVINAAHAIEDVVKQQGGRGTITVSTRRDGDMAEIRIADNGSGIPEHVQGRIFDPFFTTKEVGKGTGQGLYFVQSIVTKKHHGTVSFITAMGKGTTFLVRLPLAAVAD